MLKFDSPTDYFRSENYNSPVLPIPFIGYLSHDRTTDFVHHLLHLLPLVYRMPQKSAVESPVSNSLTSLTSNYQESGHKVIDMRTFISVTPSRIYRYQRNIAPDYRIKTIEGRRIVEDNEHHGWLSHKPKKKVNKIIDWMLLCAATKVVPNDKYKSFYSFKINFVTLTLPSRQAHSDRFLQKKLFSPFLDWVRKTNHPTYLNSNKTARCSMYFWRSESQMRGAIHWHLCTDVFIPYMEIQAKWNYLCNKLGYIDRFAKIHNHRLANSTDVHSVKNIRSIGAYLSKYCCKNSMGILVQCSLIKKYAESDKPLFLGRVWHKPKNGITFYREIRSRLWGCSEKLSRVSKCTFLQDEELEYEMDLLKKEFPNKVKSIDYIQIFNFRISEFLSLGKMFLKTRVHNHYKKIFYASDS